MNNKELNSSLRSMFENKIKRIELQIRYLKKGKPADYTQDDYEELLIALQETRDNFKLKLKYR